MKKHIPNTITCCNLVSGCIAIVCALNGNPSMALLWIIIGAVFDFFDGMSARLLNVSSPIGKELDSLADDVTFGVAPSCIIFNFLCGYHQHNMFLPFVAFLIAAFSAVRLAKFNLDERQATSFIGLPTPANALFWGAFVVTIQEHAAFLTQYHYAAIVVGMLVSCYLLVAEIPMFALKFKHWGWKGNEVKYLFIISSILLLLLFGIGGIAVVIAWYVLLSVLTTDNKPTTLDLDE
jgi:CDP-diacylglycerol--serine O-phosphatidyltransferase